MRTNTQTLYTERLNIRAWRRSDASDFFEYASQPDVGPAAGWMPHTRIKDTLVVLEQCFMFNDTAWAIELKSNGKVIGSINLRKDEKRGNVKCYTLGFSMSHDYWGQGIMPEAGRAVLNHAFCGLGANLVSAFHYPHNLRSKRVIEKLGFKYEGTLRQSARLEDGSVYDELCYSMTRQDFNEIMGEDILK